MRIAAYVLLGDPAWLVPSVKSYYEHVSYIFASYDEKFLSWGGIDMRPEMHACLELLQANDPDGKVVLLPGPFACPSEHAQTGETRQRQASIDAASERADWVLQLDTDEVVQDVGRLIDEIRIADRSAMDGLEYPARWIYAHVFDNWFLERGTRKLRPWDAIPGPVAVRAGTKLRLARQADSINRQLRFRSNDDSHRVGIESAILHFSMVRSGEAMRAKASTSPHAADLDWELRLRLWESSRHHPLMSIGKSILKPTFGSYKLARLPDIYDADMVARQTMAGDPTCLRTVQIP